MFKFSAEEDFDDVASLHEWSNAGYNSLLLSPKRSLEEQSEAWHDSCHKYVIPKSAYIDFHQV